MVFHEMEVRSVFGELKSGIENVPGASNKLAQFIRDKAHPAYAESKATLIEIEAFCADTCQRFHAGQLTEAIATADVLQVIQVGKTQNAFFRKFIAPG